MLKESFVNYIEESIRKNWEIDALADYKGESFTYGDVGRNIFNFHNFLAGSGIQKGDKIALAGRNSARWCISYLAVVSYGAVVVPILPDFNPDDITEIILHSDSSLLICSDTIFESLNKDKFKSLKGVVSLNSYASLLANNKEFEAQVKNKLSAMSADLTAADFHLPVISNADLAVISYTSGTTGHSKGVMLNHNSLTANIRFAQNNMPLNPGDPIVSFLPLAHTYGCAFEFMFPFTIGCTITILTKVPSPQVIMAAFQEIRPALILSVPLVIEKIYKKQILPVINKPLIKGLLWIPLLNRLVLSKIRKKIAAFFGGNFTEIVVGGAPFNPEAEVFFRKIKIPVTVGYGMTECGPLISYSSSEISRKGSSGKAVDTLEVIIDSADPAKTVGEIMLRGENVMLGYYKNDKATKEVIDSKGWLHTGDLGIIDRDGFIYIKGRSKSLILGPSGKNIYPEELESALNNRFCVQESLVVQREEKLVALIYPDAETMDALHIAKVRLQELYTQYIHDVNHRFPKYMQVAKFEIVDQEFQKTPKRSIKRYLYE